MMTIKTLFRKLESANEFRFLVGEQRRTIAVMTNAHDHGEHHSFESFRVMVECDFDVDAAEAIMKMKVTYGLDLHQFIGYVNINGELLTVVFRVR